MITSTSSKIVLVRYGAIAEVARFRWLPADEPVRGQSVVVKCHRGEMIGTVLEAVRPVVGNVDESGIDFEVVRIADPSDIAQARKYNHESTAEFSVWTERIQQWKLDLQLVELERTLDGAKRILYVLCERGPDSTKLALQAAAAGLGIVEVQPVNNEGLVQLPTSGGGCGTGGGGCGCSH